MSVIAGSSAAVRSRRGFIGEALLIGAAMALVYARGAAGGFSWIGAAEAAEPDLERDTFNGLLAFVLPGSDAYSLQQRVSTPDQGGVDAGVLNVLIATMDATTPFLPDFSGQVAAILNGVAQDVDPTPGGPFLSPFANLAFAEKAAVFQVMDSNPALVPIASVLPAFVAFLCYSEAGAFDPETHSLTGEPLGWRLSHYRGVSNGRAEFRGYFQNRRSAR